MTKRLILPLFIVVLTACAQQQEPVAVTDPVTGKVTYKYYGD